MLPSRKNNPHKLQTSASLMPPTPLYKRAPGEDEHGNPLSDFMMIIPKLRNRPPAFDTGHNSQDRNRIESIYTRSGICRP